LWKPPSDIKLSVNPAQGFKAVIPHFLLYNLQFYLIIDSIFEKEAYFSCQPSMKNLIYAAAAGFYLYSSVASH
jgi:hypothetical protein